MAISDNQSSSPSASSARLSNTTQHAATSSSRPLHKAPSHITLPFKGSFANLTRLIGLTSTSSSPKDGEEEEDEEEITDGDDLGDGEIDEESLMWDAQTALIAHHPDLAIKLYSQAALPPFCSPAACLALGNLLIRGSTLTESESERLSPPILDPKGKQRAFSSSSSSSSCIDIEAESSGYSNFHTISSKILSKILAYGSGSASASSSSPTTRPPIPVRKPTVDLVASGWQIPKEGKRAVRDPHSMGVAGAWFVLGLSWIVQSEIETEKRRREKSQHALALRVDIVTPTIRTHPNHQSMDEEEILSFDPKTKVKRAAPQAKAVEHKEATLTSNEDHVEESTMPLSDSVETICPPKSNPSSSSGRTLESPMVRTPGDALVEDPFGEDIEDTARDVEVLQTMYDLLQPLLKLYRHGHIQSQDPVALPPISLQTLPTILRPRTETEKRRNVWRLGYVVASKMASLDLLQQDEVKTRDHPKEIERLRGGVDIIMNYILAMTSQDIESENYFRKVIANQPTGLEAADDLIRQAAKRLDILTSTPRDEDRISSFPFPAVPTTKNLSPPEQSSVASLSPPKMQSRRRKSAGNHSRQASTSSVASISASRIMPTTLKSRPSGASLCSVYDGTSEPLTVQLSDNDCAISTLKRIHKQSKADLAEINAQEQSRLQFDQPIYPSLNGWKLSPPTSASPSPPLGLGLSQASQRTIIPSRESDIQPTAETRTHKDAGVSPTNTLRAVSSSPQFRTLQLSATEKPSFASTTDLTARRILPFEPTSDQAINPIDPELAKAELSSALTKHVTCGVCGMEGVNFPECRKCGLTFCSRECRVGEDKAGNGKKHICGLWQSKKMLSTSTAMSPPNLDIEQSHLGQTVLPVRATRVH
ncbi:uncharacterized protein I303_103251 [Kwoniella dejecticola CBS 10117]|uniref:Uncharacterized protein n=1 Tax=Kwoniella dejecticola CBS 10117 TaxID=1296121 RepID=A0AAJ8MER0_9TREE